MATNQKEHNDWIVSQITENPEVYLDKVWRMENLYWIINKDKEKDVFRMNRAQRDFFDKYLNIGEPFHRHLILKARQLGFTTFIALYILDEILFNSNREGLLISHIQKEADEIFDRKIDFAMRNMCADLKSALFRVNRNSAKKIQVVVDFGPDEGSTSSIQVSLSGRSGTFHYVHISEYAPMCIQFPKRAEEVKTGTFPAVPLDGFIFIESTAETMADDFYEMFHREWAVRDRITPSLSRVKFVPHFYNWTWDDMEMKKITTIVPVEEMEQCDEINWFEYRQDHNLTPLEMTYYYMKWEQLGRDVRKLNQQYPTIPEEAFMASGHVYFPARLVNDMLARAPKSKRYDIVGGQLIESPYGALEVFNEPKRGYRYVIGGDNSDGGRADSDYQVLCVINAATEEVDAVYRSQISAEEYPEIAVTVGKYFNTALMAIESNFNGKWINAEIIRSGYMNVYYRQAFDDITQTPTKLYGWLTSGGKSGTRDTALMALKATMLKKVKVFPKVLLEEMLTFVVGRNNKAQAISGKHDDVIMAAAIGYGVLFKMGKQILETAEAETPSLMKSIFGESSIVNF